MTYIIILLLVLFLFTGMILYKLTNPNWFRQFYSGKFKDKDLFTRIVKFLMS